jgi:NADP-dependent 3-hydroxy acid dehydrogenase YdfG
MVVNSWAAFGLLNGQPGLHGYYASKSGIQGAAKTFWNDVREFGIKMTSIYPGLIDNELGRVRGPFEYNYRNIISSDACADALLYALDAPPESCITHMVIKEQFPFTDTNQRILNHMESKM